MTGVAIQLVCRKCGSESISGPRFAGGKHERLMWKCSRCGFGWWTPPLDAQQAS